MSSQLLTLAEAKVGMKDYVDQMVIDEFRRESILLDLLTFDSAISPGTGGSTLTYGYTQLKTPSTAQFRNINEEYTPSMAIKELKVATAKVFGGRVKVDRVIDSTSGAVQEMEFQIKEKVKGAVNLFNYMFINGNSTTDSKQFDGLDKLLKDTETDIKLEEAVDLTTTANMTANAEVLADSLDLLLSSIEGTPDLLIMNRATAVKLKGVARRLGFYESSLDGFGKAVDTYNGIKILSLDKYWTGTESKDIIPIAEDGTSSIYAVSLGADGVHGISPQGGNIIKVYRKDENDVGVMREGEIEAILGIVLKNSKKAGVLRNIKVKANAGLRTTTRRRAES